MTALAAPATASPAPTIRRCDLSTGAAAAWKPAGGQLLERDLGADAASAGGVVARLLRSHKEGGATQVLPGSRFHLLYVLQGRWEFRHGPSDLVSLQTGDCIHWEGVLPGRLACSPDGGDLLEVAAGQDAPGQAPAAPVVSRDSPQAHVRGDGLRAYFEYRDLQVAQATQRRIHVHVLRAVTASAALGTRTHYHSASQFFYVFSGWADLAVEGQPDVRMHAGDAMCIARGTPHNVLGFSADYAIVEMCLPADFDTVETGSP